ncbi:nucleoside hydrolase [Cohnella sp. REN36]|uniref:nucleoside hydrolase n=1 Tax=Cohnella sp. REN36 TaxID=2887347 RepID=UPI001D15D79D|nr:nucleoside hydrolase [Cohnella sp. REN36]MCC3372410.1 nucleoside hydrolase [Cohnella sp. REN36]
MRDNDAMKAERTVQTMRTESFYEPGDGPVPVILDTDIGPDCDDAGAVAVLHALQSEGRLRALGMMNCTSSPWGAGCLDAINAYYGRGDIPVGTLEARGFLVGDLFEKYNRMIATTCVNRYTDGRSAPDASRLYRKLLADAGDGSIVIIAIGPLINLMRLLLTGADDISPLSGTELAACKVRHLVVMGGLFPEGKEWNFEMHPESAAIVCGQWPTPITFTGYEIGAAIPTGKRLLAEAPEDHPVRRSYAAYLGDEPARPSWDLTAVLYAARGAAPYWDIVRGRITVDPASGANDWNADPLGPHAYLSAKLPPEAIADMLDELLTRDHKAKKT